ncbi:YnbE family lipoprotein [Erythrobacter sp.]|jgi:hypothetical protein|uniref:YnbE family lipoprotein n=1 Tax=Erythrobacter sp. TaxID=1042 RepID=UPI003FA5AA8A
MKRPELTQLCVPARTVSKPGRGRAMNRRIGAMIAALPAAFLLPGCINISAPEEPIVIELNVNIRAEVLYRLAEDASNTIEENADIF